MGFWDGLAEAMDSVRHEVEQAAYGREVTNDIQLPQQQEPAVEPTSWQEAAQDIEPPQIEPPQPTQEMER